MSVLMGVHQPHERSSQKLAACGASALYRKAHQALAGWKGDWMAGLNGPLPTERRSASPPQSRLARHLTGSSQKAAVFPLGPLSQLLPLPLVEAQGEQPRFLALVVSLNCLLLPAPSMGCLVRLPSHTPGLAPAGVYYGGVTAFRLGSDADCGLVKSWAHLCLSPFHPQQTSVDTQQLSRICVECTVCITSRHDTLFHPHLPER